MLTIVADCRDKWTKIEPKSLEDPGGWLTISYSDGQKGVGWSITTDLGSAEPASGVFDSNTAGEVRVHLELPPSDPPCDGESPTKTGRADLVSDHADNQSVALKIRGKKGSPCTPPEPPTPRCTTNCGTAEGNGDPHMKSFDGVRFDMQTPGDYRYLVPDPLLPDAVSPQLQVRHGFYLTPGSHAKVIEALAIDYQGHRIEAYVRPTPQVLIDGEAHSWDEQFAANPTADFQISIKGAP